MGRIKTYELYFKFEIIIKIIELIKKKQIINKRMNEVMYNIANYTAIS